MKNRLYMRERFSMKEVVSRGRIVSARECSLKKKKRKEKKRKEQKERKKKREGRSGRPTQDL